MEFLIKGDIPETLKHVLKASGYENFLSLPDMTKDDLAAIENFVNIDLAPWLKKMRESDKNNEYATGINLNYSMAIVCLLVFYYLPAIYCISIFWSTYSQSDFIL